MTMIKIKEMQIYIQKLKRLFNESKDVKLSNFI